MSNAEVLKASYFNTLTLIEEKRSSNCHTDNVDVDVNLIFPCKKQKKNNNRELLALTAS